jgi:3',5'-cyclic AMP phosphodiesterase CpdA
MPRTLKRRQVLPLLLALATGAASALAAPTPPAPAAPATSSLRFLAVADSGSGDRNQRAVGLQMARVHQRQPVDLVVLGGDNIYPSGDIALVEATFQRPYRELIAAGVPFHAVLGNHDIRTANGNPQVAYKPFGMQGRYYALRRGPVEFFMIDTNVNADWSKQLPWLQNALARSQAPWKVVVGHHPVYASGVYGNNAGAIRRLTPLFKRYGVALYINGHEHHYERSKPINGITYLVVGGGGAHLRPVFPSAQSAVARSVFSFAELEANPKTLTITGWSSRGERIDRTVLNRP